MGRFLRGLILGVILGMVATTYNPNLPADLRAGLANVTALVMRGTERAAQAVGGAADRTAEEAGGQRVRPSAKRLGNPAQ
jgi:hypothetical protein